MNRSLICALTLLALFATGCPEENRATPDAATAPPAPGLDAATVEPPDAAEPGPDAGTGSALRKLVPAHLLGDSPINNLVISPHFDALSFDMSEGQWMGFAESDLADLQQVVLPNAPVEGIAALKMLPSGTEDRYLIGTIRGGKAPMLASVWIGRGVAEEEVPLECAIEGLSSAAPTDSAYPFAAEADSVQTIDRIRWTRYSARIEDDLVGLAALAVYDTSKQPIYILAPTLVESQTRALHTGHLALRRNPTAGEAKVVREFFDKLRHRPPPPRYKP